MRKPKKSQGFSSLESRVSQVFTFIKIFVNVGMEDCFFHCFDGSKETATLVTERQWETAKTYAERWAAIEEPLYSQIANKVTQIGLYKDDITCHQSCYKKFCNKLNIERAEKRHTKRIQDEQQEGEAQVCMYMTGWLWQPEGKTK